MDLRQLRYVVVLAEEEHFTRAAARLGIAQPALSQQIRRLEAELGQRLVERTTRSVALTPAGRVLVDGARRALREVEDTTAELDALRGARSGRLVIGATRTPGPVDLAAMLARFHRASPGVELVVREGLSVDLRRRLETREIDLAFLTGVGDSERLELRPVAREELVAVVPPDDPLRSRGTIELAALRDRSFATFEAGATIRDWTERSAEAAGWRPAVAFESGEVARILRIVNLGLAVSILPLSDATVEGPSVGVLRLADRDAWHDVSLAWLAGRRPSAAAEAFLAVVGASAPPESSRSAGRDAP